MSDESDVPSLDEDGDELTDSAQVLKAYVNQIFEHLNCDTVQIFVTKYDHAHNISFASDSGRGDWFSRLGYIKSWIETQEEKNRERARDETYQDIFMDENYDDDCDDGVG